MTQRRCDGGGDHSLGERSYLVIEPNGTFKQFCDSDCMRTYYAQQWLEAAAAIAIDARIEPLFGLPEEATDAGP